MGNDEPLLITEADLARARNDTEFRQQLLTKTLELLLGELTKIRRSPPSEARADQVREGVELAVKLADILRRMSASPRAA